MQQLTQAEVAAKVLSLPPDLMAEALDLLEDIYRPRRKLPKVEQEKNPDVQLFEDLHTCVDARALVAGEQEKIKELWDAATDPVERDYRAYQYELVAQQIERAAQVAEVRLRHLESLRGEEDYQRERDKCADGVEGTLYWFRMYAWGFDPREDSPLMVMPFYPFQFQDDFLRWIEDLVFVRRSGGLAEKSRDMGATYMAVNWCAKQWLFRPYFSAMLGSRLEDLVDSKKDPDSLFEKVRFQLRRQPSWMLPKGFNLARDMPYMNIANEQNGSVISGAAPSPDFGRGGRRSVIIPDELAAWPHGGYPQYTSMTSSTKSVIALFTPKGKYNQAAELRFGGRLPVFTMKWERHPWKDRRWYDALTTSFGAGMTAEIRAQEVDIDYEASQPGRILPMWDEVLGVATRSEFERVYGKRHIPPKWNLARMQDVGTTEEHLNVTAWYAKPRKEDRFNDTIFSHREFVAPVDWPVEWIGEGRWDEKGKLVEPGIWQFESPHKEGDRMVVSQISQEAESEVRTYWKTCKRYPIRFTRIKNPDANGGIAQMRALMTPLPEPNPFAIDPRTTDPGNAELFVPEHNCEVCGAAHAGKHVIGRTRFVLIVDDEEGELKWDGERLYRLPAKTSLGGHKEAREEYPLYHYPATEKDKPVAARRPFKRKDDRIDDDRYICRVWGPPAGEKTGEEEFEEMLPEALRAENLRAPAVDGAVNMTEAERDRLARAWQSREAYIGLHGLKPPQKKAKHWRKGKR